MDKKTAQTYRRGSAAPAQGGKIIKTFDGMGSEGIGEVFSAYSGQIGQLVSSAIKDRFVQIAITMIAKDRIIKECTQESVLGAFLTAAMYDLEILPQMGQSYFVPYRNKYKENMKELQFQIGYQGYVALMMRGGAKDVFAQVVHANDHFSVDWANDVPISHKPALKGDPGKLAFVWGRVINANDIRKYNYMTEAQVFKRRDKSPSAFDYKTKELIGIWKEWPEEMWLKTMTSSMRKLVPLKTTTGPDVQSVLLADGAVVPAGLLSAKGIDLSRVTYPEQDEDPPRPVNIPTSNQTAQTEEEDFSQEGIDEIPEGDEKNIEPRHLKYLVDCLKKAKVADISTYLKNGWQIKELSTTAIKIFQLKGILYDLGNTLSPEDPGQLLDDCFHLTTEKLDSKPAETEPANGADIGQQKDAETKGADEKKGTVLDSEPPKTRTANAEKLASKDTPPYDLNDIRKMLKLKSVALAALSIYTVGDLIAEFAVKSLTVSDCSYEKFKLMEEYLKNLSTNPVGSDPAEEPMMF